MGFPKNPWVQLPRYRIEITLSLVVKNKATNLEVIHYKQIYQVQVTAS